MKINHDSFCAAPWFFARSGLENNHQVCSKIQPNQSDFVGEKNFSCPDSSLTEFMQSDYTSYLRENLTNGIKLSECEQCWKTEECGQTSLRQIYNSTVSSRGSFENSWVHSYFKHKENYNFDLLYTSEVKLSNLCNFSCVMCSPQQSSKIYAEWENNLDQFFVQDIIASEPNYFADIKKSYNNKQNYKLLLDILHNKPRRLNITGGEPLIDNKMLEILDKYDSKDKTVLTFETNGSVDLSTVTKRFEDYKDVFFIVSMEGTNQTLEYIRQGSKWKSLRKNIENFVSEYDSKHLKVHFTLQALVLVSLYDLARWAKAYSIKLSYGFLEKPEYLAFSAIPHNLKKQIAENLVLLSEKEEELANLTIDNKHIADIVLDSEHNPNHTNQLAKYLKYYDPNGNWKKVFPEWIPYLEQHAEDI